MLGLIAALTPILYKHVADRREEIDNINEANTLLLLKAQTKEYIEANKDSLSVGTTILEPVEVGVDITGYSIGIRKDSDGTINAMIASDNAGNDMKAAKVASLLGVSAGIYSAQDTNRAWGINGVWAENISNYGFTSLPKGIPVVTTAYDKEDDLDMDKIFAAIEEHEFNSLNAQTVNAGQLCFTNPDIPEDKRCKDKWNKNPLEIILSCNTGNTMDCTEGFINSYNRTCQEVWQVYHDEGVTPVSGTTFNLTSGNNGAFRTTKCYFTSTNGYDPKEVIDNCDSGNSTVCKLGYDYRLNQTCEQVRKAYEANGNSPTAVSHKLTYKAYNNLSQTSCELRNNPSLTEYFYQNTPNTYTFTLLGREAEYKFELCGGNNSTGKGYGGYSWGSKIHKKADSFFVIVAGIGIGGGYVGAGGGTEIRFGTSAWQDKHRILVGGGASGTWNSTYTANHGGGGNSCGGGANSLGGCKGLGGVGGGNNGTPSAYGLGGQNYTRNALGAGGNGGAYGGGGGGGGDTRGGGAGGAGGGFGGGGGGANGYGPGGNGNATTGGKCASFATVANGYEGGRSWTGPSGGFGGGGGGDAGSGGGGYGGGGGGGDGGRGNAYAGGGGGGRVCLDPMPTGWPACDPAVWVFDEGGGETGSAKCTGNGWVRISLIDTAE